MKKLVIPLLLASMCVLSGCTEKATQSDFKDRVLSESIVDFATNELYAIGNHRVGFWIRDFWIRVDHKENEEEIMAIYAPEGKME